MSLLTLTACVKDKENEDRQGMPIRFTAASGYDNGVFTRTSYSGQYFGETTQYERIDWVVGDRIRIYCQQASGPTDHYSDYRVVSFTDNNKDSDADIEKLQDPTLNWGAGDHTFYAIYPAPSTTGVDAQKVTLSNGTFTGTIPSSQTVNASTGKPDMNYAYMWAATKTNGQPATVILPFKPAMTAFEFTVGSADGTAMTLKTFELSSTTQALSGDFTGTFNAAATDVSYTCPARTDANSKITVTFPTAVTIPANSSFTFTVFALPQNLNNLTITFTDAAGLKNKLALKESASGTAVSFAACKKYRLTKLGIPGARVYKVDPIGDVSKAPSTSAQTQNITVKSYSTYSGRNEGENWHLEYSVNGGSSWMTMTASQKPSWLSASKYSGTGNPAGEAVTLTFAAATAMKISKDSTPMNMTARSSNKNQPFDLSTHDISGTAWSNNGIETANCYVINRPGWYMFPLVYGNAINTRKVNNTTTGNTNAYKPNTASNSDTFLTPFKRHDNSGITSPYIDKNVSGTLTAHVSWQDTYPEIIPDEPAYLDIVDGSAVGGQLNCKYVRFYIDPNQQGSNGVYRLQRGNTVVKVMSGSTTLWSWHLWVTGQGLSESSVKYFTKSGTKADLYHLNVNLGWITGTKKVRTGYPYLSCKVRVVNDGDPNKVSTTFKVVRTESYTASSWADQTTNAAPHYQWGRKDPMRPISTGGTQMDVFPGKDSFSQAKRSATTTPGYSIQNPFKYIYGAGESGTTSDWMYDRTNGSAHYYNLWDATQTVHSGNSTSTLPTATNGANGADKNTVKTVYDPCPPGFCVPRRNAYSGFLSSSGASSASGGNPPPGSYAKGAFNAGYTFYTQNTNSGATIFFPGGGGRYYNNANTLYTESGFYWTAACLNAYLVGYLNINSNYVGPYYGAFASAYRSRGHSVRPVRETW